MRLPHPLRRITSDHELFPWTHVMSGDWELSGIVLADADLLHVKRTARDSLGFALTLDGHVVEESVRMPITLELDSDCPSELVAKYASVREAA
jgi:hypothetical protein